jgi:hypothetical protein
MKPLHIILCLLLVVIPTAADPVDPTPMIVGTALIGAGVAALVVWAVVAITSGGEADELTPEDYLYTVLLTFDPPLVELTELIIQPGAFWRGDAVNGYLLPVQLSPVEADHRVSLRLPPVSAARDGEPYQLRLYHAFSGDEEPSGVTAEVTVADADGTWTDTLTEPVYSHPVNAGTEVHVKLDFTDAPPEEPFSVFLTVGLLRTPVEGDPEAAARAWREEPPSGSVLMLTTP